MSLSFLDVVGYAADFFGLWGAYSAIQALKQLRWRRKEDERLNQIVSVVLKCANTQQKIEPTMRMRRRNVTRAEIQGILRTIKMKDSNAGFYRLSYLETEEYWKAIEQIQESDDCTFVIPCSPKDIEQFDDDVVKPLYEPHEQE